MKYKVTTGPKAYTFHDQSTGITISQGEVKELTAAQFSKARIQKALVSGHLRQVYEEKDPARYTKNDVKKLNKKLQGLYKGGVEPTKASKNFTFDELKLVADLNDIKADADDTAETLVEAIYETYDSENKGE